MLERCLNEEEIEEIEFKQWTTTDCSTLQTIVQSTDEFIESFLDKLEALRRHDFIAKQQSRYLAERKESLKEGEFLAIGDFSENFSFVVQDEAQSFHWDKNLPDKNPPDINPWTKTPSPKTPQTKIPQRKLMNTKYILHK